MRSRLPLGNGDEEKPCRNGFRASRSVGLSSLCSQHSAAAEEQEEESSARLLARRRRVITSLPEESHLSSPRKSSLEGRAIDEAEISLLGDSFRHC